MRDEIDGRLWVDHHEAFAQSVGRFFHTLRHGFERLSARQFGAPWKAQRVTKPKRPPACA